MPDAADWLKRAYEVRKLNNPSYSQRAFAKHLGLSSGRLSEIFSKRRLITENQIEKFSRHLHLSADELRVLKSKVLEAAVAGIAGVRKGGVAVFAASDRAGQVVDHVAEIDIGAVTE